MKITKEIIDLMRKYPENWEADGYRCRWKCEGTLSLWIANGWPFCKVEQPGFHNTPMIDRWRLWRAYKRLRKSQPQERTLASLGVSCCAEKTRVSMSKELSDAISFAAALKSERDELLEALQILRSYSEDIAAGRINYRPEDHIAVADIAIAKTTSAQQRSS